MPIRPRKTSTFGLVALVASCTPDPPNTRSLHQPDTASYEYSYLWRSVLPDPTGATTPVGYDGYVGAEGDSKYTWFVGDVDNDGDDDLIRRSLVGVGTTSGLTLNKVLLSNGDGTFSAVNSDVRDGLNGDGTHWWLTGDFNGDERTDLMRRHRNGNTTSDSDGNRLLLAKSANPGEFDDLLSDKFKGANGDGSYWFLVGNVDNDTANTDDLIRRHGTNSDLNRILKYDAQLGEMVAMRTTATSPTVKSDWCLGINGDGDHWWLTGDFNNDGRTDLVRRFRQGNQTSGPDCGAVANSHGNVVLIAGTGSSTGTFSPKHSDDYVGINGDGDYWWLTADVNGDGKTDLIRRHRLGTKNRVLFYQSNGTFSSTNPITGVEGPTSDSYVGVNDDGKHWWTTAKVDDDECFDLVRRSEEPTLNKVLISQCDGTFIGFETGDLQGSARAIPDTADAYEDYEEDQWLAADFSGDGLTDIARRNTNGVNNGVLLNNFGHAYNQEMFETLVFESNLPIETDSNGLVCPSGALDYQSYRIPSIVRTANGRLLAFAEGRKCSPYDYGDNDLVFKTSDDGGTTWSTLRILAGTPGAILSVNDGSSPPQPQPLDGVFGNPTAVVDMTTATAQQPHGTIWLFFIYTNPKYGSSHGEKYSCADYAYDSVDSECPSSFARKKHHWSFDDPDDAREIYVTSSLDGGVTWTSATRRQDLMKSNYQWDNLGPGTGIQVQLNHGGGIPQGTLVVPARNRNLIKLPGQDWTMLNSQTGAGESTITELSGGFYRNDRDQGDDEDPPAYRRRELFLDEDLVASGGWSAESELLDPLCHASVVNVGGDFETILFLNPVGDEFALGNLNPPKSAERSPMWLKVCSGEVSPECWSSGRLMDAERGGYSSMVMLDDSSVASLQEWVGRDSTKNDPRSIAYRRFNLDWATDTPLTFTQ